jgi:phosphohistidine phosphatase
VRDVLLLRHGQAAGIHPAAALLPEGEAQAQQVAEHLAPWVSRGLQVVSSPYHRAQETARLIAARWGLTPLSPLPALMPDSDERAAREALDGLGVEAPLLVVSHRPLAQRLAGVLAPFPTAGGLVLELDDWAPQGARLTYWLDPTGVQR